MKPTHRYDTKDYHDYYIHQAGKGYPVFGGTRYQRGHGLGSIFGGLFKACFVEKRSKDPRTRGFKKRLNIAGDVVQRRNIKQAAKSRLKSTGKNLLQKAMDTVGTPGQRAIKGPAKRKKTDVGRPSNRTHRMTFSDKNGTCTSQLMRSSTCTDQCCLWVLGAEMIDIGSDGSRTIRICHRLG